LAASCKFLHNVVNAQYYANKVLVASLAGLKSFIVDVIGFNVSMGSGGASYRQGSA